MTKRIRKTGIMTWSLIGHWLLVIGVFVTAPVFAQNPLVPCNGIDCDVTDFITLFENIYNFLLGFAAIIAVLMIVVSGIRMLVYQWSESPDADLENAKLTLRRAIFGLIIIITAYLVVNTVLIMLGAKELPEFLGDLRA